MIMQSTYAFAENLAGLAGRLIGVLAFTIFIGIQAQGEFAFFLAAQSLGTGIFLLGLELSGNYWAAKITRERTRRALLGNTLILAAFLAVFGFVCIIIILVWGPWLQDLPHFLMLPTALGVGLGISSLAVGGVLYGFGCFRERFFGSLIHNGVFVGTLLLLVIGGWLSVPRALTCWLIGLTLCNGYWIFCLVQEVGTPLLQRRLMLFQFKYALRVFPYFGLSALSMRLSPLLIGSLLGTAALGLFSIAQALTEALLFLPKALTNVTLTAAARDANSGTGRLQGVAGLMLLATSGLGGVLALVFVAPVPEDWRTIAATALLLLPGTYALAIGTVGSYWLFGRGAAGTAIWAPVGTVIALLASLPVLASTFGIFGASLATTTGYVTFAIFTLVGVSALEQRSVWEVAQPSFRPLCIVLKHMTLLNKSKG